MNVEAQNTHLYVFSIGSGWLEGLGGGGVALDKWVWFVTNADASTD